MSRKRKRNPRPQATPKASCSASRRDAATVGASGSDPTAILLEARTAFSQQKWSSVVTCSRRVQPRLSALAEPEKAVWAKLVAEAHFRLALDFLKRGRFRAVVAELEKALNWLPEDGIYLYHLGLAHHRLGHWSEALEAYERAWQAEPSWRVAYHYALVTLQAGERISRDLWAAAHGRLVAAAPAGAAAQTAIARLEMWKQFSEEQAQGVQLTPWWHGRAIPAALRAEAGFFSLAVGDADGAAAAFKKAEELYAADPAEQAIDDHQQRMVTAAALLAATVRGKGRSVSRTVQQASSSPAPTGRTPDSPIETQTLSFLAWALWRSGWLLWQGEQIRFAAQAWEAARRVAPDNYAIHHALALTYERCHEEAALEAWEAFANAISNTRSTNPEERAWNAQMATQIHLHLCRLAMQWHIPPFEAWFSGALRGGVLDSPERLELAEIAATVGAEHIVRQALQPLRRQLDDDPELARRVARLYAVAEMPGEANRIWESLRQSFPDDTEAAAALADAYYAKGLAAMSGKGRTRKDRALQAFEEALSCDPGHVPALVAVAAWHSMHGDSSVYEQYLTEALALCEDPGQLMGIADALLDFGLFEQAAALLERMLQQRPSAQLLGQLGIIYVAHDREDEGFARLEQACKEAHYDLELCLALVSDLSSTCGPNAAEKLAVNLLWHRPNSAELYLMLAALSHVQNDLPKAERYLKEADRLTRKTGDTLLQEEVAAMRNIITRPLPARLGELFGEDFSDDEIW
jgi:tetratricopeptide (TPR) repeat protein